MPTATAVARVETLQEFVRCFEFDPECLEDTWNGKRISPRRILLAPVWLRRPGQADSEAGTRCFLWDISADGVSIRSLAAWKPGERVWVDLAFRGTLWSGAMRVVHCTRMVSGYRVGLEVTRREGPAMAPCAGIFEGIGADAASDPTQPLRASLHDRAWEKARDEVREALRSYRRARRSWGLLGKDVNREIARVLRGLPGEAMNAGENKRRRWPRVRTSGNIRVFAADWRRLCAGILDVSQGGAGLTFPYELVEDPVERALRGEYRLRPGMAVMVGLGAGPETLWVPATLVYCRPPAGETIRAGVAFVTSQPLEAFDL
ncbi:MAG: PilZ domain-containing protein [Phycisphaerae bacterium]